MQAGYLVLRVGVFAWGAITVLAVIRSALRTLVLPRSAPDRTTRQVFLAMRKVFDFRMRWSSSYLERDAIMAMFAPLGLLVLTVVWVAMVLFGYMAMFWAVGVTSWRTAFTLSGSSLLTLGFTPVVDLPTTVLAFSEAMLGLGLVAILIAYLPTIYSAFARRELGVTMLEIRAGSPPSPAQLFLRYHRLKRLDRLGEIWANWELWFADIEESHTSLAMLAFFRSPQPEHSWVTAAGAVLDAAALRASTLDLPDDYQAALCLRSGYMALRRIADFFRLPYNPFAHAGDPISVSRAEFDQLCTELERAGIPLKADRDQAWRDFVGWRVNYDAVLLGLARITMAPEAPWSSDRPAVTRALRGRREAQIASVDQDQLTVELFSAALPLLIEEAEDAAPDQVRHDHEQAAPGGMLGGRAQNAERG